FHDDIAAHPLPLAPGARTISLLAGADWSDEVPLRIAQSVQRLAETHMVAPVLARLPWLRGELRLIPPVAGGAETG
ncbi:LysR family transcriptional regulator, partial [bacterium LRH843]|nr:LysR family transcriptional regulator [bacterium LRH843]